MPPTSLLPLVRAKSVYFKQSVNSRYLIHILGVCLLLSLVCVEFSAFVPGADAHSHTAATVNDECASISFSPDGNPFGLCPGPYPTSGGNCVWWAWEQWHLLGYDLPLNWGNAADWVVDAERSGLTLGTTPRVGAIAVFPRADGVWAYGPPGHVAFVTAVSSDGMTFNVTYQNYGDTTPMYVGTGYNVNVINEARFQNGEMRFIYFPKLMDPQLFLRLPGIGTNSPLGVFSANSQFLTSGAGTNHITLGLQSVSSEDEFNADFTGSGHTDLLLYNRQKGQLNVLTLDGKQQTIPYTSRATTKSANTLNQQVVSLADSTTASDKWGSSLDVHVGDFDGSGHAQILLYDRIAGTIQILSLTTQLTIKKHVVLSSWGPGWEVYVGRFDGKRSGLFMYKRYAVSDPSAVSTSTPTNPGPTTVPPPTGPQTRPTNTPTTKPVQPTATPKPKPNPTATPKPNPTPTPKPNPTATPNPTPTPVPTATPKPNPTPTPVPTATPQPSPTATPAPTATPTQATQSTTPTPSPTVVPTPTVSLTATPSSTTKSTTPTVTATPSPTGTPSATPTTHSKKSSPSSPSSPSSKAYLDYVDVSPSPTATTGTGDLSGTAPQDWEKKGRTANVVVLDFDQNFNVHVQQSYTLWHANWEVYVGRFVSSTQDGVFLYDRLAGEGRIMDFDDKLQINHYQESHNLDGNWMLYSGDFVGAGRSQLFMYDPSSGDGQMLAFKPDLTLANQLTYPKLGKNMVLYGGHFGMATTGIMLYDIQGSHSTFLAFSKSLAIAQQVTVKSWSQNWQVLVGNFLDHTQCATQENCATRDDILVLDRHTGKIGQYVFSFGRKFKVYDNRMQAFARQGITLDSRLNKVDSTSFSLIQTLSTSIRDEELY